MSSKRRRQSEPKATGRIVQISPAACWDLHIRELEGRWKKEPSVVVGELGTTDVG
jgi:hypothetical protein